MVRENSFSFPNGMLPKPLARMIAILLVLDLTALSLLGEIDTKADKTQKNGMPSSVSTWSEIATEASIANEKNTVWLPKSRDQGQEYIDRMVFFGESTTAHLRSRGVLPGGSATHLVWANQSNTMMLSPEISKQKIIDFETGAQITVAQAAAMKRPEYLVLSFGINGLSQFVKEPSIYALSYAKLITTIQENSPHTTILLQTVYPVASSYANAVGVNSDIEKLNAMLPKIAETNHVYLVDTASVLRDKDGMLREAYAMEDGLHLRAAAYAAILQYLRTHAAP